MCDQIIGRQLDGKLWVKPQANHCSNDHLWWELANGTLAVWPGERKVGFGMSDSFQSESPILSIKRRSPRFVLSTHPGVAESCHRLHRTTCNSSTRLIRAGGQVGELANVSICDFLRLSLGAYGTARRECVPRGAGSARQTEERTLISEDSAQNGLYWR